VPTRQVAAFDFDGTLTIGDTLIPFLRQISGSPAFTRAVVANAPVLFSALLSDARRDAAKIAMFQRLLRGRDEQQVRDAGSHYADNIVARRLRAGMLERLESHRNDGHEVVIVSASPTIYLDAVGERLGVDAVLATRLAVAPDGRLTGDLVGVNVRRAEKVRRLEEWLDGPAEIWAYGDSTGDRELLERADHPTRV
jgi:HAD superfamily hydrolase (TIGR01490 family)